MRLRLDAAAAVFLLSLILTGCSDSRAEGGERHSKARLPSQPMATPILEPPDIASASPSSSPSAAIGRWTGPAEIRRRSTLSSRVGGVVARVHVRDGDRVEAGSPLVSLETEDFALRVRQSQAALDAATAQMKAAETDWNRTKALVKEAAVPQAQFDAVDARYQLAKAGLAQADVGLDMARKAERDAILRSPYAAVVVRRAISEGEYAAAQPPTQLVTIEEAGVLEVRLFLPREKAESLREGAPARGTVTGMARPFDARVVRVLHPRESRDGAFTVIFEVLDPAGDLSPGTRVTLEPLDDRAGRNP